MVAMSPRSPSPRLASTVKAQYGTPRRTETVFQKVALARGYTVKAGAARRARLKPGFPLPTNNSPKDSDD